jgi:hypothetical protein
MIPTRIQADITLNRFTALTATKVRTGKDKKPTLDRGTCGTIADRLIHHLTIARDITSQPDGYPTRASGADPTTTNSTRRLQPEDEQINLTSVEAAADARSRWAKDEHDRETERAWGYLQDAVHALAAANQVLQRLDGTRVAADNLGLADDRWCENHLRHGRTEPRDKRKGTRACRWCADFRADVGSYPPHALIVKHDLGERIYDRDVLAHFPNHGKVGA